jgi:hypothetical protein
LGLELMVVNEVANIKGKASHLLGSILGPHSSYQVDDLYYHLLQHLDLDSTFVSDGEDPRASGTLTVFPLQ